MQTIRIDIEESKIDILLNIIKNLKDDVIKNYSVTPTVNDRIDLKSYIKM